MVEGVYDDPQSVVDKIDYEGWPDALEWLVEYNLEDEELSQMIYDATQLYTQLNSFRNRIEDKLEELGAELV